MIGNIGFNKDSVFCNGVITDRFIACYRSNKDIIDIGQWNKLKPHNRLIKDLEDSHAFMVVLNHETLHEVLHKRVGRNASLGIDKLVYKHHEFMERDLGV